MAAAISVISGCDENGGDLRQARGTADRELVAFDPIGVELGDSNCVFGMPRALEITSGGNIVVGDMVRMEMLVYSPEGTFLRSGGSQGEGPGEYAAPTGISATPDGGIPVGSRMSLDRETGTVTRHLARWESGEVEASLEYLRRTGRLDGEDPGRAYRECAICICVLPYGSGVGFAFSSFSPAVLACLADPEDCSRILMLREGPAIGSVNSSHEASEIEAGTMSRSRGDGAGTYGTEYREVVELRNERVRGGTNAGQA